MPPFREGPITVDRRMDEDLLYELRSIGHGRRINIVDASYDIPDGAKVVKFPGTSAEAFEAIVRVVPLDDEKPIGPDIVYMAPDGDLSDKVDKELGSICATEIRNKQDSNRLLEQHPRLTDWIAGEAFIRVARRLVADEVGGGSIDWTAFDERERHDNPNQGKGFYSLANKSEEPPLFVRTTDDLPYACITFVVGHSQRT